MRWIAALLVAIALPPVAAQAQPAPWAPERLTAGWVFTPGIVVGALWDSNVTLRATGDPLRSEWVGLVNPRGEIDFNGRHTRMNAGYSGSLEAYRQSTALNRYEQRGRFEIRHQARPRIDLFARAGYTVSPTTDRLELGPGVLPFVDIGSENADASGGANIALARHTHLQSQFRYTRVEFDRDETTDAFRYLLGGYSWSPRVGIMQDVSSHVSVGGSYEYRHTIVGGGATIFDVQSGLAQVAWQAGRYTSVSGGMGLSFLKSGTDDLSKWGPAFEIGVDHKQGPLDLGARYTRAFVPAIAFGGLNQDERFSGSAHIPLGQGRYSLGGSVSYGHIDPVEEFGLDFRVNSLWTTAAIGYQATRWLRAEGFVTRTHQTSTARGLVDRTRVGIQFVTSKPVRLQ